MPDKLKNYSTIGCCGIDCGLCPRFYTIGNSRCPGCGGESFRDKHPSCGFVTCCVIKKGLEVCSDCNDYPCQRFDAEKNGYDSFVTHRKVFENLKLIKASGIDYFLVQQQTRMNILTYFMENCDDGRSKSFFCVSCALLPIDQLMESKQYINNLDNSVGLKERSQKLKHYIQVIADDLKISLQLNSK